MNLSDHISKYCTYGEAIHSQDAARLGIDNTPNDAQLVNMLYVAKGIFDPVREHIGVPLTVSSFFRCPTLNSVVAGASSTSQHMKGEAIDHYHPGLHREIFKFIKDNLEFDQLIWEYGDENEPAWVHASKVSYKPNRKQILRVYVDPKTREKVYLPFDLKI